MCLFYKRLDRGTFSVQVTTEGATHVETDDVVLEALLDGIDLSSPPPTTPAKKKTPRRVH
jgi:hypothetical protein